MAVRLYRNVMRTLRGVDSEVAVGVRQQVRESYAEFALERDPARIETLLADGSASLAEFQQMLYKVAESEHSHAHDSTCGKPGHVHSSECAHTHELGKTTPPSAPVTSDLACGDHGHIHGPDCGHEHSHGGDPLPEAAAAIREKVLRKF